MPSILLIEDDDQLRETLKIGLENAEFDVTTASGGIKGLKIVKSKIIDVVVTDIIMKEGEGVETLRWIKEVNPNLPVIVMSGFSHYLGSIKQLGATEVLKKPFKIFDVVGAINAAMERKGGRVSIH